MFSLKRTFLCGSYTTSHGWDYRPAPTVVPESHLPLRHSYSYTCWKMHISAGHLKSAKASSSLFNRMRNTYLRVECLLLLRYPSLCARFLSKKEPGSPHFRESFSSLTSLQEKRFSSPATSLSRSHAWSSRGNFKLCAWHAPSLHSFLVADPVLLH